MAHGEFLPHFPMNCTCNMPLSIWPSLKVPDIPPAHNLPGLREIGFVWHWKYPHLLVNSSKYNRKSNHICCFKVWKGNCHMNSRFIGINSYLQPVLVLKFTYNHPEVLSLPLTVGFVNHVSLFLNLIICWWPATCNGATTFLYQRKLIS
jgi:hypothetical protein